ncbi:hypothetical protein [Bradyrhizobium genosp. P]|uniref:hypothetical protein n=1 Tax=Bradyrhizobium genosp. P TaxID=83641 RepID=UPI003CF65790
MIVVGVPSALYCVTPLRKSPNNGSRERVPENLRAGMVRITGYLRGQTLLSQSAIIVLQRLDTPKHLDRDLHDPHGLVALDLEEAEVSHRLLHGGKVASIATSANGAPSSMEFR